MKTRIQEINEYLLRNSKTIYRLRKIRETSRSGRQICAYAVSLIKEHGMDLIGQTLSFYNSCKQVLAGGEKLVTENRYFKVVSDSFEVFYCLEAWRKNADKVCYVENDEIRIELLHRMGCEQAAGIFKREGVDPLELLNDVELLRGYDNPADRYAALAKLFLLQDALQDAAKG